MKKKHLGECKIMFQCRLCPLKSTATFVYSLFLSRSVHILIWLIYWWKMQIFESWGFSYLNELKWKGSQKETESPFEEEAFCKELQVNSGLKSTPRRPAIASSRLKEKRPQGSDEHCGVLGSHWIIRIPPLTRLREARGDRGSRTGETDAYLMSERAKDSGARLRRSSRRGVRVLTRR